MSSLLLLLLCLASISPQWGIIASSLQPGKYQAEQIVKKSRPTDADYYMEIIERGEKNHQLNLLHQLAIEYTREVQVPCDIIISDLKRNGLNVSSLMLDPFNFTLNVNASSLALLPFMNDVCNRDHYPNKILNFLKEFVVDSCNASRAEKFWPEPLCLLNRVFMANSYRRVPLENAALQIRNAVSLNKVAADLCAQLQYPKNPSVLAWELENSAKLAARIQNWTVSYVAAKLENSWPDKVVDAAKKAFNAGDVPNSYQSYAATVKRIENAVNKLGPGNMRTQVMVSESMAGRERSDYYLNCTNASLCTAIEGFRGLMDIALMRYKNDSAGEERLNAAGSWCGLWNKRRVSDALIGLYDQKKYEAAEVKSHYFASLLQKLGRRIPELGQHFGSSVLFRDGTGPRDIALDKSMGNLGRHRFRGSCTVLALVEVPRIIPLFSRTVQLLLTLFL